MSIHIRTWPGSGTARITDMTHAGQRGKTCRVLRVSGVSWDDWVGKGDPVKEAAIRHTRHLMANFGETAFHPDGRFEVVRDAVREVVERASAEGVPADLLTSYDEEIRAIDAPRLKLTAGVEGQWSAEADEEGVKLRDLEDVNEWTELTHAQTGPRAYDLAKKVWGKVQQAATRYEASCVLREAGVKLHGFCAVD